MALELGWAVMAEGLEGYVYFLSQCIHPMLLNF